MTVILLLIITAVRLLLLPALVQVAGSQYALQGVTPPLPGPIAPHLAPMTRASAPLRPAPDQPVVADATQTSTPANAASSVTEDAEAVTASDETAVVLLPTATHTPQVATATPTGVDLAPLQQAVTLTGFQHAWQTWNNCGPATLSMNLSYYGATVNQAEIGAVLRRFPDDKNVSPHELAAYAREQGYQAQIRADGSTALAKTFLSNGIPILIETWLEPEPNDGMGHYRLLTGYDESTQRWIAYDSYVSNFPVATDDATYAGIYLEMTETERLWRVFNYTYVLVYTPQQESLVATILGSAFDSTGMWQQTLARAQADVNQQPDDAFAWFNLGTNLVRTGAPVDAVQAFDRARALGLPWRMFWYQFELFAAYHAAGRYDDIIQIVDSTLAVAGGIEELHYWKGQALHARNDLAGARQAWQSALQLNPDFTLASAALNAVQ